MNRKHILFAVVALGLVFVGMWALTWTSPSARLARHHDQWLSHPILNYRYTVHREDALVGYATSVTSVEVRNGTLLWVSPSDGTETCPDLCTVEGLFNTAARALISARTGSFWADIDYHSQYGFPERIGTGYDGEVDSGGCWIVSEFEPTE